MKKIIIKIIISIIVISLAITGIALYNNLYKDKKATNNQNVTTTSFLNDENTTNNINENYIEVTIILKDKNNKEIINDKLNAYDKTLFELLNENYTIRCEDTYQGKIILDFESIKTDFKTYYLAIYVNGRYSDKGLSYIVLEYGMVVEFRETKL